jgi:dTDP-4-dehydrorhamnose 3,5-epimerase
MPFEFERLELPGVFLIQAKAFPDERGFFLEIYRQPDFKANGIVLPFVQDNFSYSRRGALRGLHYQKEPKAQGKLVSVLSGEIFDVVVDLRRGSPTYCQWMGVRLREDGYQMLYVPEGFAHGFQALTDDVRVAYKVTAEYAPGLDRGIAWNDPELGIKWPIPDPLLSAKDSQLPNLNKADNAFVYRGDKR